jgi:serine/threonine protein kinase
MKRDRRCALEVEALGGAELNAAATLPLLPGCRLVISSTHTEHCRNGYEMILPPEDSDPLVGHVFPSGLRVLERLEGGSEQPLYRAQYSETGPPVAFTLLRLPQDPRDPSVVSSLPARLAQQLRRASQIRHPNVAGLLEVGETPDRIVYAVCELLPGQPLSEVLSIRGTLPLAQAVDVCLQAAAGLQAAHRMGVVHGVVSPHTILLTPAENGHPVVKLIGFDFSWYERDYGRSLGQGADNPYSSPERLAGSAPDELSDLFSLGAVLHHLLVGTPPGYGSVPNSVPRGLLRVVDRALGSPDERYPTVAAFAEALSQAAGMSSSQKRAEHRRPGWRAVGIASALLAACLWLAWNRFPASLGGIPHSEKLGAGDNGPATQHPAHDAPQPWVFQGPSASVPSRTFRPRPVETGTISDSNVADSAPQSSSPISERRDSGAGTFISQFRRSHPWAAQPDGRFYFPSSCPLALASSDLVYFESEREARATGRSRSTAPGCAP